MLTKEQEIRRDQILSELNAESDRGCILVGASVLDCFLEDLIKVKFSEDKHVLKHAISPLFDLSGPLSSFSSRIKLAYALSLIAQHMFTDLNKIRSLRNLAAHQYSSKSFDNEEIISVTKTLVGADHLIRLPEVQETLAPMAENIKKHQIDVGRMERMRFTYTVIYLASTIEGTAVGLKNKKLRSGHGSA